MLQSGSRGGRKLGERRPGNSYITVTTIFQFSVFRNNMEQIFEEMEQKGDWWRGRGGETGGEEERQGGRGGDGGCRCFNPIVG